MFQSLSTTWDKISHIGTDGELHVSKNRSIILTNQSVFFLFCILLGLFFFNFSINGWSNFNRLLLYGNLFAITFIFSLNHLGQANISRVFLCWMCSVYPFYASISVKLNGVAEIEEAMYFMPRLFILTTAIIPVLVFSFQEKLLIGISLLGSLIPIVFFDRIHEIFGVGYYDLGFTGASYPRLNAITIASYTIILVVSFFFKSINERFANKNLRLIDSLERKNLELTNKNQQIEEQSKELEVANYEIRLINSNLEKVVNKRTKKILDQATQFQIFSFKNSHELRAPLTNVMGVLELLKDAKSQQEMRQLLDLLNESCKNLDEVVHDINRILNESVVDFEKELKK
ncbi:histidine kinase dimerization/phospho-acceptor domain-containing protein [Ekhidna sp.]|uniref:histidine kinase dimerization/phospho-acceptor domain-containing protein n=1 Tax=Ekhidna sp. TaxID=2608089 RepID=UPI003CCC33A1